MIVPISANLAFPLVPYSSILYASNFKIPIRARAVCCLRKNEQVNGIMKQPIQMELEDNDHADFSQTSASETELKKSEIWKLFREAQQNILYLNKQRLMAEEELNKANKEKQALLDRIEELEAHQQSHTGQDKLLAQWGVLLRIDSMVLTGMIGTKEASDLRRLIMDSKVGILDALPPLMMQTRDSELLLELRTLSEESKRYGFHVIHICTEMEPVVTVGSLASYVTGLSRALQRRGNSVEVILPKYKNLDLSEFQELREIQAECHSYFNGQLHGNRMWTGVVHGIGVTFIEPVHFSTFFNRDRVYGYSDDFERFMYFSRASLDYIVKSGKHPDVLHIHNWETSIIGPLFWDIFVNQGLGATRILLTCQDFSSQCVEQPDKLGLCGLDPLKLHRPDRLQDNAKPNLINILKGGLVYSNKVIIMSSIHSKGLIIQSRSHGLESTLTTHKDKLIISPSGFNYSSWDPSKDKFLPENYTASNLKGKAVCKAALQQEMALSENPSAVVIGCIFPETSDVDLENLMDVLRVTSMTGVQLLFMGVSKIPSVNRTLNSIEEELKDENVRFINKYDEGLSRLIFGGSDIVLCQSYDDPVLQLPLKAIKYGAAPIAITSIDRRFRHVGENDIGSSHFSQYINSTFANMTLMDAIDEIKNKPLQWNQKIMDSMTKDFSWDAECCDVHLSAYESLKHL